MDLKKNKFLTAYLAVLIVGLLVLGWLFWSSYSAHESAQSDYNDTRGAINRLESAPLYPNEENIVSRKSEVDAFAAKVGALQKKLLAYQKPLIESPDASKFQTKLADSIKDVKGQADSNNVKFEGEVDLGLPKYQKELPVSAAVPDLDFELDAIKNAVDTLITDRVSVIGAIVRRELAVESDKGTAPATGGAAKQPNRPAAGKAPAGPKAALDEDVVLKRFPFTIRFQGSSKSFEDVLNSFATAPEGKFFYAIREIRVENDEPEGQVKTIVAPETSEQSLSKKSDSHVVLGREKLNAWLAIDVIRFIEPVVAAAPVKGPKPAAKP